MVALAVLKSYGSSDLLWSLDAKGNEDVAEQAGQSDKTHTEERQ